MSLGPTYVRARDGAFYRNPVLISPEGFVCFDESDPPEFVAWFDASGAPPLVGVVLKNIDRILGRAVDPGSITVQGKALRVVPNSEPWEFRSAVSYFFELAGRIPRPQKHDGTERYLRNCSGAVYDFPAHALDAAEIEVPKRD